MAEIDDETFEQLGNEIRDTINWIKIFEEEYDLPPEVVGQLRERLESIASKLSI